VLAVIAVLHRVRWIVLWVGVRAPPIDGRVFFG
jgi:hypothetical protein